jgi:hypothetical protein
MQRYMNGINSAFNGMLRGMLTGTETFQQAFRKMVQGLLMDFVSAIERMVEQWLMMELTKTSTTATQTAVRDAIQASSDKGDIAGANRARAESHYHLDLGDVRWRLGLLRSDLGPGRPGCCRRCGGKRLGHCTC